MAVKPLLFLMLVAVLEASWFFKSKPMPEKVEPGMANIPGSKFLMGIRDRESKDGEAPPYQSAVKPFRIDIFPVTNEGFLTFAKAKSKFRTDAETRGWSNVFVGHLYEETILLYQHHKPSPKEPWMIPLMGASWRQPFGPDSDLTSMLDHPVVHVSKRDAQAYCYWKGKRLPSEFEWEYAARGGLRHSQYPWGDSYKIGRVNIWQGHFPDNDTAMDGYAGTSPVGAFPAQNNYGLHDMVGNVWEWTSTTHHFRNVPQERDHFVVKGGSYLDTRKGHVNYKARASTRTGRIFYYSAGNLGFRCAKSAPDLPQLTNVDMSRQRKAPPLTVVHSEL